MGCDLLLWICEFVERFSHCDQRGVTKKENQPNSNGYKTTDLEAKKTSKERTLLCQNTVLNAYCGSQKHIIQRFGFDPHVQFLYTE